MGRTARAPAEMQGRFSLRSTLDMLWSMNIVPFSSPDLRDSRSLFSAYLDALKVSLETEYTVRLVVDPYSEQISGLALCSDDGPVSALALEDCVDDVWSLFDAMHFYFEMVTPGEA